MASSHPHSLSIYLVAGEPSGDNLGGRIMTALKALAVQNHIQIHFAGVGGERMTEAGLKTLFPLSDITLFGLTEIIPHLFTLWQRLKMIVTDIKRYKPDAIVTIDSTAFSFALARRLKKHGIPLIHVNAPKVWAYRPRRAKTIAQLYDHLLALLPFEPPWFEGEGLKCTFIGHPVIEYGADKGDGRAFRKRHKIPPDAPLLCVLPGSRTSELRVLLPIFEKVVRNLTAQYPDLYILIPTIPSVASTVRAATVSWPGNPLIIEGMHEKFDGFSASTVALAASGTVTVELALAKIPTVVAYKVSALTAALIRRFITVRYVSIVNLLQDRAVIPEFIQENCTPAQLIAAVIALLKSPDLRAEQIKGFTIAATMLGQKDKLPSERAAIAIWETIMQKKSRIS